MVHVIREIWYKSFIPKFNTEELADISYIFKSTMAFIFLGFVLIPSLPTTRYFISLFSNSFYSELILQFEFRNCFKVILRFLSCPVSVFPVTTMSSKHTKTWGSDFVVKTTSRLSVIGV